MESLLYYVWKYRLFSTEQLSTTNGTLFTVIDPGIRNTAAGPDFFNAKIKIDNTVWVGSIEIHEKASDWFRHGHEKDKAYDSVILHVVGEADTDVFRSDGQLFLQFVLTVPEAVQKNIDWLLYREVPVPCIERIGEVCSLHIASWLEALLSERLERKTQDIFRLLDLYKGDWNEVFYILLTRNFGFGINSDAFEWLAKSLPLRYIQKQRGSSSQVEALLFGQAGMLDETIENRYYKLLQREYQFLKHKFDLKPLDASLFKSLRMRPGNFPHLKLAQLAAIWLQHDTLFSVLLDANTPSEIKNYFRVSPYEYWNTHYHFRYSSEKKEKKLGESGLNILLINTVVPMFFAYSIRAKRPEYSERALRLLESLPPENNFIVTAFTKAGVVIKNAGDTQALIQLYREYCEKKKCLYCRVGFRLLKQF